MKRITASQYLLATLTVIALAVPEDSMAEEPTLGEIRLFSGNFAPRNWAFCDGQLIKISSKTALFVVLGNEYGGDGKTTFALPNLNEAQKTLRSKPDSPASAPKYIICIAGAFPSRDEQRVDPPPVEPVKPVERDTQNRVLGEIRLFSGQFAPRGFIDCDGRLLPIRSNQSLFSILRTDYGGDGRTNFAVPNLTEVQKALRTNADKPQSAPRYIIRIEGDYPRRK